MLLLLFCVGSAEIGQSRNADRGPLHDFKSPDHSMTLHYSGPVTLCEGNTSACRVSCSEDDDTVSLAACISYAGKAYANYNFKGASLSIGKLPDVKNNESCVNLAGKKRDLEKINGVPFESSEDGEGAAGTFWTYTHFRAFHDGKCYMATITVVTSGFDLYEPGTVKKFKLSDYQAVYGELSAILKTLRISDAGQSRKQEKK